MGMSVSWWQRNHNLGSVACDVAVVGAGICGVSAALHLARRGLRVVVLEQESIASKASGRNAGFLMRGAADNYARACKDFGRERARSLWRLTEENLVGLRSEGIGRLAGTRDVPSVLLAIDAREAEELVESERLMREDGFAVSLQRSGDDAAWRASGALVGLVNPADASCHSMEVVTHLCDRARALGVAFVQQQEVVGFAESGSGVRVECRGGVVSAARALVCTNAYAGLLLPGLVDAVVPRRGQIFAARLRERDEGFLKASYYLNWGSEYIRQAADGTVIVGGCRTYHAEAEVGYEDRTTEAVQGDLERFAARVMGLRVGVNADVVARWAGTMGFTKDHLPLVGAVDGYGGRVWFCGGFTGHGMSMAYRTSAIAVDAMLDGGENPFALSRG